MTMSPRSFTTCVTTLALLLFMSAALSAEPVSFRKDVAPILRNQCQSCHGNRKAEGGYRVDTFAKTMTEGDSGAAAFTAKDLGDSEVFRRITSDDADDRMPLDGPPLSAEQVALVKRWIEEGAKFDGPDPKADLLSIIPPPVHPSPPETYPRPIPLTAMAFSPDGSELFVGGYHEIHVWNPETGELVRRIKNQGQRTYGLDVSPDGKLLAAASGFPGRLGEVRVFELASGKLVRVLGTTWDACFDVAFDPSGKRLAVASADSMLGIYDTTSGKLVRRIASHSDWVTAVAWSADGKQIISGSRDKTAKVFDAQQGNLVMTYIGHNQAVRGVAFHPDGKHAYSSGDGRVHQWKLEDGKRTSEVGRFGGEAFKIHTSDKFLFAGSTDGKVRQWDRQSRRQVREYKGSEDWVISLAYSAKTDRLAAGGFQGQVTVFNAADGKPVVSFFASPGYKNANTANDKPR